MTTSELADKICQLAEARHEFERAKAQLDGLTNEFNQMPSVVNARERHDILKNRIKGLEARVRMMAIEDHKEGRTIHPAIKIQPRRNLKLVYEEAIAIEWAIHRHPKALALNKAEFENIAKVVEPRFVTFEDDTKASIKQDLSAYLPMSNGV